MATTIDTLEVKIAANAQSATDSLKSLTSALKRLSTALTGIGKDGLKVTDHVAKSLNEMNGALNTITTSSIKKIQKLANGLNDYADALKRIKSLQNVSLKQKIQEASPAVSVKDSLDTSTGDSAEIDLTKIDKNTPIDAEWKKVKEKAKATTHIFGNLVKSIARIALYRAIRSALKAIAEAFDEGLKNAYGFSQQSESFKRLAETMDRIKTITSQMINQIGAFWGEVKQFVLPAVEWLVEKVRWVAERLTELFAALNGETTYLQAKLVAQTWGEATDNVKKYKQQLLGLDELNNLTSEKKSGKEETDYSNLYEEVPVDERLFKIAGKIKELGIKVGDILFDWTDLKDMAPETLEGKILAGLGGIAGGIIGGVPGAIIGTLAGVGLEIIFDEFLPTDNSKEYDSKEELGKLLLPGVTGLLGGLIGAEAGVKGAVIGFSVGATIGFVLNRLLPFEAGRGKYAKKTIYNRMEDALKILAGGIIGWSLGKGGAGKKIKTALVGMTIGAILTIALNRLSDFDDDSGETKESVLGKVVSLLNGILGIASAGLTGAKIGSLIFKADGAMLGASVGVTLALLFRYINHENQTGENQDSLLNDIISYVLTPISGGVTGAVIGWKATGSAEGAILGASIGVILTLMFQSLFNEDETGMDKQGVGMLTQIKNHILIPLAGGAVGGAIGWALTGNRTGAVLGAEIGVALIMLIHSIDWKEANDKVRTKTKEKVDEVLDKYGEDGTITTPITGVDVTVDPGKMVLEAVSDSLEDTRSPGEKLGGIWSGIKKVVSDTVEDIGVTIDLIAENINDSVIGDIGRWMEETMPVLFEAGGGLVGQGSLFYAGEAGPEFVGSMGNSSAVANTEQMTDAIYKAAYMGMSQALRENGGNGLAGFVPATTDDLFIAMRKKANNYNKMTGNSAFA